jgi:hypothetical protein
VGGHAHAVNGVRLSRAPASRVKPQGRKVGALLRRWRDGIVTRPGASEDSEDMSVPLGRVLAVDTGVREMVCHRDDACCLLVERFKLPLGRDHECTTTLHAMGERQC